MKVFFMQSAYVVSKKYEKSPSPFFFFCLVCLKITNIKACKASKRIGSAKPDSEPWRSQSITLHRASMLHAFYYMLNTFFLSLEKKNDENRPIFEKLGRVYMLHVIVKNLDIFLFDEVFTPAESETITTEFHKACMEMRANVLVLVDAWDIPDFVIKAPIARYDGNIYEAYFEAVLKSRDAVDYHESYPKPSYWQKSIRPLVHGKYQSKI